MKSSIKKVSIYVPCVCYIIFNTIPAFFLPQQNNHWYNVKMYWRNNINKPLSFSLSLSAILAIFNQRSENLLRANIISQSRTAYIRHKLYRIIFSPIIYLFIFIKHVARQHSRRKFNFFNWIVREKHCWEHTKSYFIFLGKVSQILLSVGGKSVVSYWMSVILA